MIDHVSHSAMERLSNFIAAQLGLHYPKERWNDLEQAVRSAVPELGMSGEMGWVEDLTSLHLTQSQTEVLARHLTVGETYFFREQAILDILEKEILPPLIRARREEDKRLRIWSAGCCTGEEPYSIAILLERLIPDLANWNITVLATDINPRFLRKGLEGIYNKWSFRETPAWVTERYFKSTRDGCFELLPPLRKMVTFSYLNLVDDSYPALVTNTNAMDLILCRNVLMYFTRPQAQKVIQKMHHCLIDGGWLLVGASETSESYSPQFTTVSFPGATFYKKEINKPLVERTRWRAQDETPTISIEQFHEAAVSPDPQIDRTYFPTETASVPAESQKLRVGEPEDKEYGESTVAFEEGRYTAAAEKLLSLLSRLPDDPKSLALLAHVYANLGKLAEAKELCERAISYDKLLPRYHYLLGSVLMAQGNADQAVKSFKKVLYLDQNFVLAHFALGNLTRQQQRFKESKKHYENALLLLGRCAPAESLPEAEGMTAARLNEIIRSTIDTEQGL